MKALCVKALRVIGQYLKLAGLVIVVLAAMLFISDWLWRAFQ